ncbi:hypothetical protein [Actinomycetospora sp. NBC_00405]|uniref:hypothetical protein n=1 Tax=Actinomycetospora sp. NBC_00405 TaxID=2975952 RepID=UPI002E1CF670
MRGPQGGRFTPRADGYDPADEPLPEPASMSDWLRDQDVLDLAVHARASRLSGASFVTHLLDAD